MSSPFEQGAQMGQERAKARKDFISRYKKLLLKIHPDKFNGNGWEKESNEITQKITNLKDGCDENGKKDPNLDSWQSRLDKLDEIERELEDFLKRSGENNRKKGASGKKEASDKKNKNTKDKEETKKEPEPKSEPEKGKKDEAGPEKSDSGEAEGINNDFEEDFGKKEEEKSGEKSEAEEIEKDLTHDLGGKKEGEKENQEKNPEEKEKENQERAEKIEKIKQELEIARKEYAEMYFQKKKMWDRVKGFFGDKFTKEGKERAGRAKMEAGGVAFTEGGKKAEVYSDQDVAFLEAIYENKLIDYKSALLDDLQSKELQGEDLKKEMGEIMRIFNLSEAANLYDAKTEARTELAAKDNSTLGKMKEKGSEVINWYIKQPTWKKLLLAGGLGIGAVSASYAGAAVASSFMVMNIARRILAGSATAVGMEAGAEKVAGKYREKKSEKEINEYLKKVENFDLKDFNSFLTQKTFEVNEKFEKRNVASVFRKSGAILFGALAASGAASKIFNFASEKNGAGEWVKEHIFGKDIPEEVPGEGGTDPEATPEAAATPENPSVAEANVEQPTGTNVPEENIGGLKVGTGKTGSLWGTLNEHFKGVGLSNEEAAKKASEMSREYIKEHGLKHGNLIHSGYEIKLDPSGSKIIEITDPNFGDLQESYSSGTSHIESPPEETVAGGELNDKEFEAEAKSEIEAEKEFSDVDQSSKSKIIEQIDEKNNEIGRIEEHPATGYNPNDPTKYFDEMDRLKGDQKALFEELAKEDRVSETAGAIRKIISVDKIENWNKLKGLTFDQLKNADVSNEAKNSIAKIYRLNMAVFGKESMPKNGETVAKWTERLARLFMKIKK